jgi:hypothetical protein
MASSYPQGQSTGAYIQTTTIQDQQVLRTIDLKSEDFRTLLMRLYENIGTLEKSINQRTAGFYPLEEFINGNVFFPNPALDSTTSQKPELRQEFRKVINFGTLPAGGSAALPVAHGITVNANTTFTNISAVATKSNGTAAYIAGVPIPYSSAGTNGQIEIWVDATYVYIATGGTWFTQAWTIFNNCYVILEYLQN